MSNDKSRLALILSPVCLVAGFGLAFLIACNGTPPANSGAGGDDGASEAQLAELKEELKEELKGELKEELKQVREDLAESDKHLEELSSSFSEHFLVSKNYYEVTKVVDGDTFELGKWKVRLLGVNTPESVHPGQPVAWYGIESSNYMKKLLLGKKVRLEPEAGQQLGTGAYNRVLAYPFLEDGTDVAAAVVRGGYGQSYHKYPCARRAEFDKLQAQAKAEGIGQWNDEERLVWEDLNIIPDVPVAEAKVIVAKSGTVHSVSCGAGPSVKNGTFFKSVKQAAKFKFTKHHSCVAKMDDSK